MEYQWRRYMQRILFIFLLDDKIPADTANASAGVIFI